MTRRGRCARNRRFSDVRTGPDGRRRIRAGRHGHQQSVVVGHIDLTHTTEDPSR